MHLHPCFLSFFSPTILPLSILHPADFISFHPPLSIKLHLLLHPFMLLVLPPCQPPSAHPSDLLFHPPSMHQSIDVPVHICVSTACYGLAQIDSPHFRYQLLLSIFCTPSVQWGLCGWNCCEKRIRGSQKGVCSCLDALIRDHTAMSAFCQLTRLQQGFVGCHFLKFRSKWIEKMRSTFVVSLQDVHVANGENFLWPVSGLRCCHSIVKLWLSLHETLTTLIPEKYQRPVTIYCRLSTMENQKEQMETARTKSSAV